MYAVVMDNFYFTISGIKMRKNRPKMRNIFFIKFLFFVEILNKNTQFLQSAKDRLSVKKQNVVGWCKIIDAVLLGRGYKNVKICSKA